MIGGVLGRMRYALGSFLGAWNAYNVPSKEFNYESLTARQWRYNQALHYYTNTAYSLINKWAEGYKQQNNLYKHIRSIYNPVARLVDFYPGKIYGGAIDLEKLTHGAIPIAMADDVLRAALRQLFTWSNFGTQKSIFVRYGAMYGDTALKIVDDRESMTVRVEVLDPRKIKHIEKDAVGNVKRIVIEYMDYESSPLSPTMSFDKSYIYTETIDEEKFATYKNNQPFAYYEDADGHMSAEWPNEYGFVPVVLAQHKLLGLDYGGSCFHTCISKIDEANDAASLLNDQVRKAVQTIWWAAGVNSGTDLQASTDKRDVVPMIYAPTGSQPHAMVANIQISSALANIQEMLAEIERDLPELSLHRLRDRGNLTAPGVQAGYSDAIDRIMESRANYDDALVRALQMGIAIAGFNRYDGFKGFSLDQYHTKTLDFHIADRPVIQDQLSEMDVVQTLVASGAPNDAVWKRIGYDDDTIADWKTRQPPQVQQLGAINSDKVQNPQQGGIRGEPLPKGQGTTDIPITQNDVSRWNSMFESMIKAKSVA